MWCELQASGKIKYIERYKDPLTLKDKKVSITITGKDTAANRKKAMDELSRKIEQAQCLVSRTDITLDALFNAYTAYQAKTVKASTLERNKRTLRVLCDLIGKDAIVDNLSSSYVNQKLLSTGKEPTTLNEYIRRFKAMLHWGYDNDYFSNTFFLKLKSFNTPTTKRERIADKYLESDEVAKLLDYMSGKNEHWYYVTKFMILSGLRIGELIALNKDDITGDYISVNKTYDTINNIVTTPKTNTSNRDVYITPELEALIKEYTKWRKIQDVMLGCRSQLFFHGNDGGYIQYYTYEKYLKESSEKCIGRRITTHALRHTHASLLLASGVSVDTISRRLGHDNSRITKDIYLHVTEKLVDSDNKALSASKIL